MELLKTEINEQFKKELKTVRYANVLEFLKDRKISFDILSRTIQLVAKEHDTPLIVSSVVQGLATPTSDIDIFLMSTADLKNSIPSPIDVSYEGNHIELTRYQDSVIRGKLNEIKRFAAMGTKEIVDLSANWSQSMQEFKKVLYERMVNGVTFSGNMPYIDYYADLSKIWIIDNYFLSYKCLIYASLSKQCYEEKACTGYIINSMLYLKNSLMSSYGDVYSGKKWLFLRWKKFLSGQLIKSDRTLSTIASEINSLDSLFFDGDFDYSQSGTCIGKLKEIQEKVSEYYDLDFLDSLVFSKKVEYEEFQILEGLNVISYQDKNMLIPNAQLDSIKCEDIFENKLGQAASKALLSLIQMNFIETNMASNI